MQDNRKPASAFMLCASYCMQVVTRKLHIRIIYSLIDKLHFGVIWLTTQKKKKSPAKTPLVCFSLGHEPAGSSKHKKEFICWDPEQHYGSDLICSTKNGPCIWSYAYTHVLWWQCWFKNFLPCMTVHCFIHVKNGVVGYEMNYGLYLIIKKNQTPSWKVQCSQ